MNQLSWYTSEIWNQKKYDEVREQYTSDKEWYNYLISDKIENFGEYFTIVKKILSDNGKLEIEFMNYQSYSYMIDAVLLLTGKRSKVFETKGIIVYTALCRLLRILNKKNNNKRKQLDENTFKKKVHDIFPETYPIEDTEEIINTILHRRISEKNDEQKLWDDIVRCYFGDIIPFVDFDRSSIVGKFENALKHIIGENGEPSCVKVNEISSLLDYKKRLANSELRHKILSDLRVKVCPYCNRNYVTWYKCKNEILTTADLDHYYQNKRYHLFALSLFNFIPSCQICNSRLKGTKPMEDTLYPFEESFGNDAVFRFKPNYANQNDDHEKALLNSWLGIKSKDNSENIITIEINEWASEEKCKKIKSSKKLFCLEEIYNTHSDKALEIALIARCYDNVDYMHYCKLALKGIKNQLEFDSMSVFEAYYDHDWIVFGYHWHTAEDSINFDAPLSRMTWDIYQQYCNQV